jgi:Kef-type K+ transport system membrane component KefB
MKIMESDFLTLLAIILGVSALVVFLLHKLKIPSLVGFLVAGVIIGPHGVGLVRDTHAVEVMAEIGVILSSRASATDHEPQRIKNKGISLISFISLLTP